MTHDESSGELLWTQWWTIRFHKKRGLSWLAEWLLASQEGLWSMELVVSCYSETHVNWREFLWILHVPDKLSAGKFQRTLCVPKCALNGTSSDGLATTGWNTKRNPISHSYLKFSLSTAGVHLVACAKLIQIQVNEIFRLFPLFDLLCVLRRACIKWQHNG
jgi:hypothetical protein